MLVLRKKQSKSSGFSLKSCLRGNNYGNLHRHRFEIFLLFVGPEEVIGAFQGLFAGHLQQSLGDLRVVDHEDLETLGKVQGGQPV